MRPYPDFHSGPHHLPRLIAGKCGYRVCGSIVLYTRTRQFRFNEAVSFQVICETQEEVDYYWDRLSEGGDERAQQCGWLEDKFGLSWQVFPRMLTELVGDPRSEKSQRAMRAMLQMKKIDLEKIREAYDSTIA